MNARLLSFIYGIVFAAVGLFGFTPNPLVSYHGFFATGAVHNGVHVLTGGIFVAGALKYPGHGTLLLKVMGLALLVFGSGWGLGRRKLKVYLR